MRVVVFSFLGMIWLGAPGIAPGPVDCRDADRPSESGTYCIYALDGTIVARPTAEPVMAFDRVGWSDGEHYRWRDASTLDVGRSMAQWDRVRPWRQLDQAALQGQMLGGLPGVRLPAPGRVLLVFIWNTG